MSYRDRIKPLRPLVLPLIALVLILVLILSLPSLAPVDRAVIAVVDQLPVSWVPAFSDIAWLGEVPVLIVVALIAALVELVRRHPVRALVMALSLLALPLYDLIKTLVQRARPVTEFVASHGLHDYSFPSGHSAGSAAVYGMMGVLVASQLPARWRWAAWTGTCGVIGLVGLSRVYLGAHFPTDVLGGWLLGLMTVSGLRSLTLVRAKQSPAPVDTTIEDTTEAPDTLQKS